MLDVSHQNLKNAYKTHVECLKSCSNSDDSSLDLILFYAVECGLKYLVMNQNQLVNTSEIKEKDRKHPALTHNLQKIIDSLKIPAKEFDHSVELQTCIQALQISSIKGQTQTIGVEQSHQALRYGIEFEPCKAKAANNQCSRKVLVSWLNNVLKYLDTQIK